MMQHTRFLSRVVTGSVMAATIGKRMRVQTHSDGHSDEITLPGILDRLSRLENGGFSYDELLHDFASRRRVRPVNEEIPGKKVVDPAEETDVVVKVRGLDHLHVKFSFSNAFAGITRQNLPSRTTCSITLVYSLPDKIYS